MPAVNRTTGRGSAVSDLYRRVEKAVLLNADPSTGVRFEGLPSRCPRLGTGFQSGVPLTDGASWMEARPTVAATIRWEVSSWKTSCQFWSRGCWRGWRESGSCRTPCCTTATAAVARWSDSARRRGGRSLTQELVERFLLAMDVRLGRGEIGPVMRSSLEKSARAMLEFQQSGELRWRRRRPRPGVMPFYETVLEDFAGSSRQDLTAGSTRLVVGEARQFLSFLDRASRPLGELTVDEVRRYLVEVRPRHASGMENGAAGSNGSSGLPTGKG